MIMAIVWPRPVLASLHLSRFGKILLGALLLRLVLALWASWGPLQTGEQAYHQLAQGLVHHRGFVRPGTAQPTSAWAPAYPAFLAAIYSLFGVHPSAARVIQAVLGLLVVFYTYQLARRAFSQRVAEAAAAIMAVYPGHLFFSHRLSPEPLFTFFLTAGAVLLCRATSHQKQAAATLGGLLWGLAALTWGPFTFFLPLTAVWLLFHSPKAPWSARLHPALAFLIPAAFVLGPWVLRNVWIQHSFMLVDTHAELCFYQGNNPWTAAEQQAGLPDRAGTDWLDQHQPSIAAAPEAVKAKLAWRYIAADPRAFLLRTGQKAVRFWGLDRTFWAGIQGSYEKPLPFPIVLLMGLAVAVSYLLVLVGGMVGLSLSPTEESAASVPPLRDLTVYLLVFFTVFHALTLSHPRFQFPLIPFLAVFAAGTLIQGPLMWQQRAGLPRHQLALGTVAAIFLSSLWAWEMICCG